MVQHIGTKRTQKAQHIGMKRTGTARHIGMKLANSVASHMTGIPEPVIKTMEKKIMNTVSKFK